MTGSFLATALVLVAVALPLAPVAAEVRTGAADLITSVHDVETVWTGDPEGGARYPQMLTYVGRAEVDTDYPDLFPEDTWGTEQVIRPADLAPDAATDPLTSWRLRASVRPIKARLLNDAGVNFQVATVPYGPDIRLGQGAVGDLYFWGGVRGGTAAFDGDAVEEIVVNEGVQTSFPDRTPSDGEGRLEWDHASTVSTATSRSWDPSTQSFLKTDLVMNIAAPTLKVVDGDLTEPASAERFSVDLPEDTVAFGGLAVYPTGLPGVDIDLVSTFPDSPNSFLRQNVDVSVTPSGFWPESRLGGPVQEWVYRPLVVHYGIRRGQGTTGLASFDVPVPAGAVLLAQSATGQVERIGPMAIPGTVHVSNVDGRQRLELLPLLSPNGSGTSTDQQGAEEMVSPRVRGFEGDVGLRIEQRDGVPVISGLRVGSQGFGDVALPYLHVDGSPQKLGTASLVAPPQISPIAFGNATNSYSGSGLIAQLWFRAGGVSVEVALVATASTIGSVVDLYVLDIHSVDGQPHRTEIDWYSKPSADRLFANGHEVTREIVTHEELNGGFGEPNAPDIVAREGAAGPGMRYFLLAPVVIWQADPRGAAGMWGLLVDHGSFPADPLQAAADGETLRGPVGVAMRQWVSPLDSALGSFLSWTRLQPA